MGRQNFDYVVRKLLEFPVRTYGRRDPVTNKWTFGDFPSKSLKDLESSLCDPRDEPVIEKASVIPLHSGHSEVFPSDFQSVDAAFGYKGKAFLCGVGTFIEIGQYGQKVKRYSEFCVPYGKESRIIKGFFEDGPDIMDISGDGERILFGRSHVNPDPITVVYDTKALEFLAKFDPALYQNPIFR